MAAMAIPEKYKNPPQLPPTFTGTKDSILADAKKYIEDTRSHLDKLVAGVTPESATFDTVTRAIAHDENEAALFVHILGFYQYVSGTEDLRNASTEADKLMNEFGIECAMREDVFKLAESINNKRSSLDLDPESDRLAEKEYKNFIKYGLTIPAGPQRDRFKEIKKRLSEIQIQFQKNLNEENGGLWLTPKELEGVPQDVLDGLEKGKDENEGKLRLSFKYPDLFPTLKFALSPETRRKVFVSNENKVSRRLLTASLGTNDWLTCRV